MILDAYHDTVRRALADQLTHVGFGSSDATVSPDAIDYELADAVTTPVTGVSYSADNVRLVKFHFELPRTEGNGLEIREIALLAADGRVVARKTRAPILKTPDMTIAEYYAIEV